MKVRLRVGARILVSRSEDIRVKKQATILDLLSKGMKKSEVNQIAKDGIVILNGVIVDDLDTRISDKDEVLVFNMKSIKMNKK